MNLDLKGSISTIFFKKECNQLRKEIIERVNLQLDWNHVSLGIHRVITTCCKSLYSKLSPTRNSSFICKILVTNFGLGF